MPDRTKTALTASQQDHLLMLLEAGATDRDAAVGIFDHPAVRALNPNVVGILAEKLFAANRTRTVKGRRATIYWLTAAGADKARELAGKAGAAPDVPPAGPPASPPPAGFVVLRHDQIDPDPLNARKAFDAGELEQLADTLASHGLLQKPTVWRTPEGRHQLTLGERRWRAWGRLITRGAWPADHTEPCLIETADEAARMEAALIENLQRVDLNHMEVGDGFELLGARFHLANDQIARKCGRTKEYVQQHRRLTKLDQADQARLRGGALTLHDALEIVARPKAEALGPLALLALAEIVRKCHVDPRKGGYYGGATEVAHSISDPALDQLKQRRLVTHAVRDWQTQRDYVSIGHAAYELLRGELAPLQGDDQAAADALLLTLRRAAVTEAWALQATHDDEWVTPFLRGPFELHPDAEAKLVADKQGNAEERVRTKAQKAKRLAALAEITAVSARVLGRAAAPPADDALPGLYAGEAITFPVAARGSRVVDAQAQVVCDVNWRFGENGERIAALLALSLNLARGRLPASLDASAGEAAPEAVSCLFCGCTEAAACETEDGPCRWVEPRVCSNPDCRAALEATHDEAAAEVDQPSASGAWDDLGPVAREALGYADAVDVLRVVGKWPKNGLTALLSVLGSTVNPSALPRRLDGLHRAGLIDQPRAATITAAGLAALEALDRPAAGPKSGPLASMLSDQFAQDLRAAAAEEVR